MKLEIPIIVGFDDLESLLDDLKKLQTYKLFEGDEMVLVDIEDVAKVLMDHVKAKKSVKGDTISRKAVYDALECMRFASEHERKCAYSLLEQIPTTQSEVPDINVGDINKFIDGLVEIFADIRESHVDDSVCGLCEFDGAYIGESGDWCNECPGFNRDDCFKLRDGIRKKWIAEITACMPSAQPDACENTCEIERKSNDLISRQDAIDGFYNVKVHAEDCTEYDIGYNDGIDYAISKLSVMPSAQPEVLACGEGELIAQPEIIRCKDCVLTDGYEPIADGRYWCMLHGAYMYYCSAAERRTDE